MSTDSQNPRSPDQQYQTINDTLARMRYPWTSVKDYRDDGVSGRSIRKRAGFKQMLEDLRSGRMQVDLILVDTLERLGRMEELPQLRRELANKHGVLVLTADTNFADPTSPQGRVFGLVESMRSTEAARIKAHDVVRGKLDAARQKRWPGAKAPFGFRLKSVLIDRNGYQEVDYNLLVPDPETAWIVKEFFHRARTTGEGQARLARFLNSHPDIPEKYKPFEVATIGYWLDNPIYKGTLRWNRLSTDVIDDARVIQRNAAQEVLYIEDFCEALVSKEDWDAVQALRQARRDLRPKSNKAGQGSEKQILPAAPGMTLKYLLTGLVRCGHCGRAMTPNSGRPYTTVFGEQRRYTSYSCPGHVGGGCPNDWRTPEPWLREQVVQTLQGHLFPVDADGKSNSSEWLAQLVDEVRRALEQLDAGEADQRPALAHEHDELGRQIQGWTMTLGNPSLAAPVRLQVEAQLNEALARQQELQSQMDCLAGQEKATDALFLETEVAKRLARLAEVLASNNPTLGNLELSLHIDRIDCYNDHRVVMRTCRLGSLAGVAGLLQEDRPTETPSSEGIHIVKPRRRAKLRLDHVDGEAAQIEAAAELAVDPERFSGLDERWFWTDEFEMPEKQSWAKRHAEEVWRLRCVEKVTWAEIARRLGKTIPTLRAAFKHAEEAREQAAAEDEAA